MTNGGILFFRKKDVPISLPLYKFTNSDFPGASSFDANENSNAMVVDFGCFANIYWCVSQKSVLNEDSTKTNKTWSFDCIQTSFKKNKLSSERNNLFKDSFFKM